MSENTAQSSENRTSNSAYPVLEYYEKRTGFVATPRWQQTFFRVFLMVLVLGTTIAAFLAIGPYFVLGMLGVAIISLVSRMRRQRGQRHEKGAVETESADRLAWQASS